LGYGWKTFNLKAILVAYRLGRMGTDLVLAITVASSGSACHRRWLEEEFSSLRIIGNLGK
jgi:hypothetical protein